MAATQSGAMPLSDEDARRQLRRAVIASTIGTTIEWYDFFLYSTVTGLVFAKLYFPESAPLVGTLQAFLIYAVGFVARPVGAAIFGHYGDRIGRKATLIVTLLLMGVATFAVAFVPTYTQIGIWGAVLLTVLRFIQGVGVGDFEFPGGGSAQRLQMCPAAHSLPHFVSHGAHVGARRDARAKLSPVAFDSQNFEFLDLHRNRLQGRVLMFARQFVGRHTLNLLGGKRRWHLFHHARKLSRQLLCLGQ